VELQGRYNDIRKQGLGLVAISYDSAETLKKFADSRGIRFPLVADPGSAIIRPYGLLNEQQDPTTKAHGVPHPGTLILDPRGVVKARFFEAAYRERYTGAAILATQGVDPDSTPVTARTDHLTVSGSISDASVAPGERISIIANVTPNARVHVYAPGRHGYRVVRLVVDPQPWLRAHDATYPSPGIRQR